MLIIRLYKHCNLNYQKLFTKYPRLILSTEYDQVFPTLSIKPYKSQIELMSAIKNITITILCLRWCL